jgi:zinc protease
VRKSKRRAFLAAAAVWLGFAAAGAAGAPRRDRDAMPVDPSLRQGTLPNGLRYVLLPRHAEPDHVSLRLVVQTGSLDEREDERGYAHFVEHMAFEGTAHYPSGKLVLFLQRLGLGFGADLNADTSFTHTIYKLDLPAARYLPEALAVFRDYADGLAFPEYALDKQRGVVLSELHARATAQYDLTTKWIDDLYAGTPLPDRMPIGDKSLIEKADAPKLRAYYRRGYRPERMIVVVVGDFAPERLEPALRQLFGSMTGWGPRVAPVKVALPAGGALRVDVLASPVETAAAADLVSLVAKDESTRAGFHAWMGSTVVINLLNRRLAEQVRTNPRIGNAFALVDFGPDQLFAHLRIEAQSGANDWQSAVSLVEQELRRARTLGFQPDEVRESVFGVLANLRGTRDEVATYQPNLLADRVAAQAALGQPWPDLDAEIADASAYLAPFTPADAAAALRGAFPETGLHLILRRPTPLAGGAEAVLAAYQASAAQPLAEAPSAEDGQLLFHYGDMLSPGAVAQRRTQTDLRLDEVTFANGVRLNLRPSAGESHLFGLSARLGRGVADTPPGRPRIEFLGVAMFLLSDLGQNTQDEVTRLLRLHAVQFNFTLTDYQMAIDAVGPTAELPFTLRLLTAYLSDLKLDRSKLNGALGQYAVIRNKALGSTEALASNETYFQMTSSDPRANLPSIEQLARYPFDDVTGWMRTHWLKGPVEVGVTGNIDVESTIAATALTLGALPPRTDLPFAEHEHLTLLEMPYRKTVPVSLPDQAATLRVAWPASTAADIPVNAALQLAIDAIADRLRIQLRDELGATYSPLGGVYQAPDQPGFCFPWIELTFDPTQAKSLANRTLALANDVATQGITAEEFARLREPRRAQTAAQLGSNFWWLQHVLVRAQTQPSILGDVRALTTAYTTVTREDVNRAAAQYLHSAKADAILIIPARAPAAP